MHAWPVSLATCLVRWHLVWAGICMDALKLASCERSGSKALPSLVTASHPCHLGLPPIGGSLGVEALEAGLDDSAILAMVGLVGFALTRAGSVHPAAVLVWSGSGPVGRRLVGGVGGLELCLLGHDCDYVVGLCLKVSSFFAVLSPLIYVGAPSVADRARLLSSPRREDSEVVVVDEKD